MCTFHGRASYPICILLRTHYQKHKCTCLRRGGDHSPTRRCRCFHRCRTFLSRQGILRPSLRHKQSPTWAKTYRLMTHPWTRDLHHSNHWAKSASLPRLAAHPRLLGRHSDHLHNQTLCILAWVCWSLLLSCSPWEHCRPSAWWSGYAWPLSHRVTRDRLLSLQLVNRSARRVSGSWSHHRYRAHDLLAGLWRESPQQVHHNRMPHSIVNIYRSNNDTSDTSLALWRFSRDFFAIIRRNNNLIEPKAGTSHRAWRGPECLGGRCLRLRNTSRQSIENHGRCSIYRGSFDQASWLLTCRRHSWWTWVW